MRPVALTFAATTTTSTARVPPVFLALEAAKNGFMHNKEWP